MTPMSLHSITTKEAYINNNFPGFMENSESKRFIDNMGFDASDLILSKQNCVNEANNNQFRLQLTVESDNSKVLPYKFKITVYAIVEFDKNCKEEEKASLLNLNTVAIAYQACREKLAVLNALAEIPVFRLPILNIAETEIKTIKA